MKVADLSNNVAVRFQFELVHYFRELLAADPDLRWTLPRDTESAPRRVGVELDGKTFQFAPLYELRPNADWLQIQKESLKDTNLILVTPSLSSRTLDYCKQNGIAAIDLSGRTWLRAPGLLVNRGSLPGRSFHCEFEPRNIFVGKSARILRCLLTNRERLWRQSEIVPRTQASPGLVSRIIQHLIRLDYVEKVTSREFRLRLPFNLLDIWDESDSFVGRNFTKGYAGFLGDPLDLACLVQKAAQKESISLAFTQWIAAWLRHPFTEPPLVSAYVSRIPDASTLKELGLREVTEGGKLWLHVPEDEGIFLETQTCQRLTLTTDAQIYLDLQNCGLRAPEAGDALRGWEGFCKP